MKVLVTGGSGYVGSHAVRELQRQGHDVTIYDNLSTGHPLLAGDTPLVVGDIGDTELLARHLDGVDLVMHFAASAYVGESMANPRKYFANNVESALKLMDAVLASKVRRFVFSSTCAVYGTPSQLPIVEGLPKDPINPYGATKLFFERVLTAYAGSHGLHFVALRYFNAAGGSLEEGIGEIHDPESHLIPLTLRAALGTGSRLQVFGSSLDTPDGTCVRDFVHVKDLARAHAMAAEYLLNGGDSVIMNLGSGKGTSIKQLMAAVERVSGRAVPHDCVEPRAGDPPALYANPALAEQTLGWKTKLGIQEIVEDAYAFELERENLVKKYETSVRDKKAAVALP